VLHCYEDVAPVPTGVIVKDARHTMPEKELLPYLKFKRLALFSDVFRYRLLHDGADIWSDLDVFCLKPLPRQDYLMAYGDNRSIVGGTLALPSHSPLLARLLAVSSDPTFIPPWFSARHTVKCRLMKALGMDIARRMPWATLGPLALTWYAKETGEDQHVIPMDMLYPVHGSSSRLFFEPGLTISDLTTSRTLSIHLYNETFRRYNRRNIPDASPLRQMLDSVGMSETSL
jgi:hypothetical protein